MRVEDVYRLVGPEMRSVEEELGRNLRSAIPLIPRAAGHLIFGGGKRLRPLILILAARICGYRGEGHTKLACALEYIHTATLLHDDVVDEADYRRGQASVNALWGNETSVLLGDFLLARAFGLLVRWGTPRTLEVIAEATSRLAEGEIMELMHRADLELSERRYLTIISRKTASLFEAAGRIGAILGGASPRAERAFGLFGRSLGMAFQMVDDVLDYTARDRRFGKPLHKDLTEGKVTLPLIRALRLAGDGERQLVEEVLEGRSPHLLDRVVEMVRRAGGFEYALSRARRWVERAKAFLRPLPASREREALLAAANYVLERTL